MSAPILHTQVLPADSTTAIARAAGLIRAGQLVAFPTETVYGLGANAFDSDAVARIFEAKGRPRTDPLIIHVASTAGLSSVAGSVSSLAQNLMEQFWPGPLTLLLPRSAAVPDLVTAGLPTVAVRMPAHPVALALLHAAGVPIAAPSANRFAHTSPTTAGHVLADLEGRIPLILDGGPTRVGVESTILELTGPDSGRVLRPGGIAIEQLRAFVPNLDVKARYIPLPEDTALGIGTPEDGEVVTAPGMLLRHYAPRARFLLFEGRLPWIAAEAAAYATAARQRGEGTGYLLYDEAAAVVPAPQEWAGPVWWLGSCMQPETIAQRLYAGMRWLDEQGVSLIVASLPPENGIGLAVRDRMIRAAEGQVLRER